MSWNISESGWITDNPSIKLMPRPNIEHGALTRITGIIVHQTDSDSAQQTLNSYRNQNANGAHFLIDRDGTIYQVASLKRKTWHVGKLRSKCLALHSCSPAELRELKDVKERPTAVNRIEMRKSVPLRYPSNEDSIGIEIVGRCDLPAALDKPGLTADARNRLRADFGVFEEVTPIQNRALQYLVANLSEALSIPDEVYPHSTVSRKNITEAVTAKWR